MAIKKAGRLPGGFCAECGAVIPGGGARRLCDACRKRCAAERAREQRAALAARWLHTPQQCESCGKEFFAPGECRFCPGCRNIERGKARRERTRLTSWVVGRARHGQSEQPGQGDAAKPTGSGGGPGGALVNTVQREGGVQVLPPCAERNTERQPPRPPEKGTRPGSMADVSYRLDLENYERWLRGERPISYGYFVAYLEGRMPLKK